MKIQLKLIAFYSVFILFLNTFNLFAFSKFQEDIYALDLINTVATIEEEVEGDPNNYGLRVVLGSVYFKIATSKIGEETNQNQPDHKFLMKAEKQFKEALLSNEYKSISYYNLGLIELNKDNNVNGAIEYLKKAIDSDSKNKKAYSKLNLLYIREGLYQDSIDLLMKAQKILGDDEKFIYRIYMSNMLMKNYDDSIENASKLVSLRKDLYIEVLLATANYHAGNFETSISQYEKILKRDPKNGNALMDLSSMYEKLGDRKKAIKMLETAIEYYPDDNELKDKLKLLNSK